MAFVLGALFGQKNLPLVGLDIGATSIKMVELSGTPDNMRLECFASEPLPREAVIDGNIENAQQVSDAIDRLWKKTKTRTKRVAMALPAAAVITKKIVLPNNLSDEELEVQVESEANQYIPFPLEEVSLDFCILGPSSHAPEDNDILLAASRREKVEDRVAVVQTLGLEPVIIDLESYAARAALYHGLNQGGEGAGQIIALFELNGSVISVCVLLDGQAIYERDQPFGGQLLTQDIMRTYNFSYEEAEMRKKSGDLPKEYAKDCLQPFVERLSGEVARIVQFFFTATPHSRIDQIILAGGCAALPGVVESIRNQTQIVTSVANPFKQMEAWASQGKGAQEFGPSFLVATGLALRRFDHD